MCHSLIVAVFIAILLSFPMKGFPESVVAAALSRIGPMLIFRAWATCAKTERQIQGKLEFVIKKTFSSKESLLWYFSS